MLNWLKRGWMWLVTAAIAVAVFMASRRVPVAVKEPEPKVELDRNAHKLEDVKIVDQADKLEQKLQDAATAGEVKRNKTMEEAMRRWNEGR